MDALLNAISNFSTNPIAILDSSISFSQYTPLDLSIANTELKGYDITDYRSCQSYIDLILERHRATVAYGGYLEKRNLYTQTASFTSNGVPIRNVHLGIDYWCKSGTKVLAPLSGTVHSFENNKSIGDYGPTIILEHQLEHFTFYSLYGHLSKESIDGIAIGDSFQKGEVLAKLGTPDINVNYAPHLHFQLIRDIEGNRGDYPGVCSFDKLPYYSQNCPDPNILLKIT